MGFKRITTLILLLILGYGLFTFLNQPDAFNLTAPTSDKKEDAAISPDFFMESPVITQYTTQGERDYIVVAEKVSHFPHNDISLIDQPDILITRKQSSDWHTTSRQGRILPGGDVMELWDNVVVREQKTTGNPGMIITTEFLTVYADQNQAKTKRPVTIKTVNSVVNAVGMNAYLDEERVELLSNVRGTYEVQD
ncbi:LPS export ABC transporter periplasmic protein LptC [Zooshikella sp. RANM57]|uniref:LPS export ABC transporter periplasmic protein LptC n=1 Tax=Zooshikella sp. RANM57 TaxID=3425863 RepID=UPI003D6F4C9A